MNNDPTIKKQPHKLPNKNFEKNYGNDYLKWKRWDGDFSFGMLKKFSAAYFQAEVRKTKHKFSSGSKVLEIGFGEGAFLTFARQNYWDISCTEINEDLVKVAKKYGYDAHHTDNLSGFDDGIFDLVVAFDVLEHIDQKDLPLLLSEIKRILKTNGFFLARFPNGDSPFGLKNQNGDITHVTTIGSGKISFLVDKVNMKVVFIGGEAEPLCGITFLHFIHRLITLPIKKIINFFINLIFFPRSNVAFSSTNLVLICKKSKTDGLS